MCRQKLSGLMVLLVVAVGCPGESGVQRNDDAEPDGYRYDTLSGMTLRDGSADEGPVAADGPGPADATPVVDAAMPKDTAAPPPPDAPATTNGEIGDPCLYNQQCKGGLCAQNTHTGARFCTKVCDPCAPDPCPVGSGCQDAGMAFICAPGYPNAPCS